MNAIQLLEVTNKVFVNRDCEAQQEADKRMNQKAALLAVALRRSDQVKQFPHGKGKLRRDYLYATTSVPIAKRPDTGGMSAPIAEGHLQGRRSSVDPAQRGTSLSQLSKTFSA